MVGPAPSLLQQEPFKIESRPSLGNVCVLPICPSEFFGHFHAPHDTRFVVSIGRFWHKLERDDPTIESESDG